MKTLKFSFQHAKTENDKANCTTFICTVKIKVLEIQFYTSHSDIRALYSFKTIFWKRS